MVAGSIGPFTGALNNAGDTIRLRNNSDRLMDELNYGTKGRLADCPRWKRRNAFQAGSEYCQL